MDLSLFKLGFTAELSKLAAPVVTNAPPRKPIDVNAVRLLGANENLGEVNRTYFDRLGGVTTGPGGTTRGEIPQKPLQTYPQYEQHIKERMGPYQQRFTPHLAGRQLSEPQMAALTSMAWRYPKEADRIAALLGKTNDTAALAEWRSPRASLAGGKPNALIQPRNDRDSLLFEKGWDAKTDTGQTVADYVRGKLNRQTWNGKPLPSLISPDPHNLRTTELAQHTTPAPRPVTPGTLPEPSRRVGPLIAHRPVPRDLPAEPVVPPAPQMMAGGGDNIAKTMVPQQTPSPQSNPLHIDYKGP